MRLQTLLTVSLVVLLAACAVAYERQVDMQERADADRLQTAIDAVLECDSHGPDWDAVIDDDNSVSCHHLQTAAETTTTDDMK